MNGASFSTAGLPSKGADSRWHILPLQLVRLTWWTRNCTPSELEKEADENEKESAPGPAERPAGECPAGGGAAENMVEGLEQVGGRLRAC